jgi:HEAT repeat protein
VKAGYQAIRKIGVTAVPILAAAIEEENSNIRNFAIASLGRFGSDAQSAIPALLQAFKNADPTTRYLAINALESIGVETKKKEVVDALIDVLKDKDASVWFQAVGVLSGIGESAKPAIPALLKALEDKKALLGGRSNVISALRAIGAGAKAVPAISRLLRDKDSDISNNALAYLQELTPEEAKEAVPALIAILKTKEYPCLPAVAILTKMGPTAKEAIPALNELLRDEDKDLRESARKALKAIGPADKR